MKFYVTGRSSNYDQVKKAFAHIKEKGHEVTFEWTELPMVKPYSEHRNEASANAVRGIDGVVEADVYIIFSHPDGNGVYTEFGAALASRSINGKPKIFEVGEQNEFCMFNYHPAVEFRENLAKIFEELGL